MKKLLVTLIALGFSGIATAGTLSDDGAPHNFYDNLCGTDTAGSTFFTTASTCDERGTGTGWNQSGEMCKVCHTPHKQPLNVVWADAPLWNRDHATGVFVMYSDTDDSDVDGPYGTLHGAVAASPQGTSKICLSCHDGVTALDAYGVHMANIDNDANKLTGFLGGTGITIYGDQEKVGVDLRNSHPISVDYDLYNATTNADGDPDLKATTEAFVGGNGLTVADVLETNRVECSSCHNVHGGRTSGEDTPYLLRVSNAGSELCLGCHDK